MSSVMRGEYRARGRIARVGDFLRDHKREIQILQWFVVLVYVALLAIPCFLPLPDRSASVFNNLTIAAQFAFWGLWWPFVLVSMPILGRSWCGIFCPEGALTEWASKHGRGGAIPRWMRWGGWPFVAFCGTTIYGQLVSVYQYPWAVAAVLGGSTIAAMVVGWLYGRNKRVWCKYLCPVNGVFNVLAKLSPWHFAVNGDEWRKPTHNTQTVNCAPLLPLRSMKGAADCHMCGRCSDYRGAITLSARSPEEEIVQVAEGTVWQTTLIVFGMMGLAVGAFLWSASPWYVDIKQSAAAWLIDKDIYWPLSQNAPWFILTHYPEVNDSMSWLDGSIILLFMAGASVLVGGAIFMGLYLADALLPAVRRTPAPGCGSAISTTAAAAPSRLAGVHKLAQGLIPAAGIGVFLGLSATTITLLQHEGVSTHWANPLRFTLLALALAWSLRFEWRLAGLRTEQWARRSAAVAAVALGLLPFCWAWVLFFVRW